MGEKSPTPSFEINKNQYTTILRYFLTKFYNYVTLYYKFQQLVEVHLPAQKSVL